MAVSLQPWHALQPHPWVSATLAAFAAAVKQQMHPLHGELVEIEQVVSNQADKSDTVYQITLLGLEHQLQVRCYTERMLLHLVESVCELLDQVQVM